MSLSGQKKQQKKSEIRWILSFLLSYKKQILFIILCFLYINVTELAIPRLIGILIDRVFPQKDLQLFYWLLAIIIVAVAIMYVVTVKKNTLVRMVQEFATRDLQSALFQKIRELGVHYYEKRATGEILGLLNTEVYNVQRIYRDFLPWLVHAVIYTALSIGVMAVINLPMAMVTIPCLLIYFIFAPFFERKSTEVSKKIAENRLKFSQKVYENISALREIRATGSEEWGIKQVLGKLRAFNKAYIMTYWYSLWGASIRRLSYYGTGIILIVLGFVMFRRGYLTTGEFVTFLLYFFSSMHHLTSIVSTLIELNVVKKQAYPLMELMQETPKVTEKENAIKLSEVRGEITFQDVSFGYTPDALILKNFNLRVYPGERVAIVGMSGSGKSTLLRLLMRFYDPLSGTILLDGISIKDLSLESLRSHIGIVFQETYLFGASVRDNILFGNPEATDEMVYTAAKAANAHEFIEQLPQKYDTLVGERGVRLSGGQQQRIALARLFLKNPAIVLLDEATSAMDNKTEAEIQKALDEFLKGRTTLTIAHRLSTVKNYDRIIYMEHGKIVESGSFDQLVSMKGNFHKLLYGGVGKDR